MDILNNNIDNNVSDNIPNDTSITNETTNQEPTWLNDIPNKFKENVTSHDEIISKLAKSYTNLEQMNSKIYGKPDKYVIDENLVLDQGVADILTAISEKNNFSQDVFNKLITNTAEIVAEKNKEYQMTIEQQQKELDEKIKNYGSENIEKINNFLKNINIKEENVNKLNKLLTNDFEFINVLDEIMNNVTEKSLQYQPKLNNEIIENHQEIEKKYLDFIRNRLNRPTKEDLKNQELYFKIKKI
jgi:hypothetical protein